MNGFSWRHTARLCTLWWCQLINVKADVMTALWHQKPYASFSWHVHLSSEARTLWASLALLPYCRQGSYWLYPQNISAAHFRLPSGKKCLLMKLLTAIPSSGSRFTIKLFLVQFIKYDILFHIIIIYRWNVWGRYDFENLFEMFSLMLTKAAFLWWKQNKKKHSK